MEKTRTKPIDNIMKVLLKEKGFTISEIRKIMKGYKAEIKSIDIARDTRLKKKEEKESSKRPKLRHGTTCVGAITDDEEDMIVEM